MVAIFTITNVLLFAGVYLTTQTDNVDAGLTHREPDDGVQKVTAHFCPYMCTIGDAMMCNPPPCTPPQCVDPAKIRPTDCCEYCLNGSNCKSPDGVPIKYDHSRIISGKNCTCQYPPFDATCTGI